MDDLTLAGVSVSITIALLVQMAKEQGLSSRWAWPLAVLLGVVCALVRQFAPGVFETVFAAVALGILVGSAASGMYSGSKSVRGG